MTDGAPDSTPCPNCEVALSRPPPRFCPACGQETRVRAPTLMEFVQQLGGAYFATEGALWRTLRLLLTRPGELTRQYLAGRRKHYVLPLRLFLSISVVVLLAFRLLAQTGLEAPVQVDLKREAGAAPHTFTIDIGSGRAGMKDGVYFCTGLPAWVCHRLQRRIDVDAKGLQREVGLLGERMVAHLGSTMFVLLPSFALFLKLAFIDRRLRYTEHLVFALHLHAFWFLALALMLFGASWLTGLAVLAMPLYAMRAARHVYGGGFWSRLARVVLVGALYLTTLAAAMGGLVLWAALA